MARKTTEWITSAEAARILSEKSGHEVSSTYVRYLAKEGKIDTKQIDGRTKLYSKNDAESYKVAQRGTGEVRRAARTPKGRGKKEDKPAA